MEFSKAFKFIGSWQFLMFLGFANGQAIGNLTEAGRPCMKIKRDCLDLYLGGCRRDGVFQIDPKQDGSIMQVFCDMTYNGGGWTVIQRRVDDTVDFYRDFGEYARGFGDLEGNMWLGLENIHKLTKLPEEDSELHISLLSFSEEYKFAKFAHFYLDDNRELFKLHVSGYYGTAGDSVTHHNGMYFSAYDHDADKDSRHCARVYRGGWWYNKCMHSDLNGLYLGGPYTGECNGIYYRSWKGCDYSFMTVVMKVRRHSRLVSQNIKS